GGSGPCSGCSRRSVCSSIVRSCRACSGRSSASPRSDGFLQLFGAPARSSGQGSVPMRLRMPLHPIGGLLAAGLALSACGGFGPPAVRESQVEERALDADGAFSLDNVNGQVEVATWSEPRVRIEAEKASFSEARLRAVRVEIQGEGRQVSVRTRVPG